MFADARAIYGRAWVNYDQITLVNHPYHYSPTNTIIEDVAASAIPLV